MSGPLSDDSAVSARADTVLRPVWINWRRWNRKAIRNPSAAVLELCLAVFSLLLFTAVFGTAGRLALGASGFGDVEYVTFLLPAVLVQLSMSTAISSGLGVVTDLRSGMFEKVVVSPMPWTAVLAGKAASELCRIACYALVVLGLGVAMGATVETGLAGLIGVVLLCLLFGVWYMALSNALAVLVRDEAALDAAGNVLLFPVLFVSSAFLPVSTLPPTARTLAALNPVTYGVDAIRAVLLGRDVSTVLTVDRFGGLYDTLVPAVIVLVALDLVFGTLAVVLLSRAAGATVE